MPLALGSGSLDGLRYIFFLSYQLGGETANAMLTWALLQPGVGLFIGVKSLLKKKEKSTAEQKKTRQKVDYYLTGWLLPNWMTTT